MTDETTPNSVTVYGNPPTRVRVDGRMFRLIETTPYPTAEDQYQWGAEIEETL